MATNIDALVCDAFATAITREPQRGAVMRFIVRAPSGKKGPLETIWIDATGLLKLRDDLNRCLKELAKLPPDPDAQRRRQ